eukprot:COSAG02_NODE_47818_length_338_cov_0.912134_1_plen_55_part_01
MDRAFAVFVVFITRVIIDLAGHTFGDYSERVSATAKLLYKLLEVQGSLPSGFQPA